MVLQRRWALTTITLVFTACGAPSPSVEPNPSDAGPSDAGADLHSDGGAPGDAGNPDAGGPACVVASPSVVTFPTTVVGCAAEDLTVNLYNTCQRPVALLSARVAGAASSAFTVSALVPSGALGPGRVATVRLGFRAASPGRHEDQLLLATDDDGSRTVSVALRGDTVEPTLVVDLFRQPRRPLLDTLVVFDDSEAMRPLRASVERNLATWLAALVASPIDFRVTLTSTCDADGGAGCGAARPSSSGDRLFTRATPNLVHEVQSALPLTNTTAARPSCLVAATASLGANASWLRSDALLSVLCVTNALEHAPLPNDVYLDALRQTKGAAAPALLRVDVVGPFSADAGCAAVQDAAGSGRYSAVTDATAGLRADICAAQWAPQLARWASFEAPHREFFLSSRPQAGAVTVLVAGQDVPQREPGERRATWRYDGASNAVVFDPRRAPAPGTAVEVRYPPACQR